MEPPIDAGSPDDDSTGSEPAPRTVNLTGTASATALASGTLTIRVERALLASSRRLIEAEEYAAAIVAAQTGCEVFFERMIRELYEARGIDWLDIAIDPFVFTYSPLNDKVRRLYVTLSDDYELVRQPFWTPLTEHAKRRHKIVHEAAAATAEEAGESYEAVDAFMNYVGGVIARAKVLNAPSVSS